MKINKEIILEEFNLHDYADFQDHINNTYFPNAENLKPDEVAKAGRELTYMGAYRLDKPIETISQNIEDRHINKPSLTISAKMKNYLLGAGAISGISGGLALNRHLRKQNEDEYK